VRLEGAGDDRARRLDGHALPPERRAEVDADLEDPLLDPIGPEARAADVGPVLSLEDRPVRQAVLVLRRDLAGEAREDVGARGRSMRVDEARDGGVAPQAERQIGVVRRPGPEAEASRGEKIGLCDHRALPVAGA